MKADLEVVTKLERRLEEVEEKIKEIERILIEIEFKLKIKNV